MRKRQLTSTKRLQAQSGLSTADLECAIEDYLRYCRLREESPHSQAQRQMVFDKYLWYHHKNKFTKCSAREIEMFREHLAIGHRELDGRFGNPHLNKPLRNSSIQTYHKHLSAFFRWAVEEDLIEFSPLDRIPAPKIKQDQVQPFSIQEIQRIEEAARKSRNSKRDRAIILLLFDTGLRASELCSLKVGDLDVDRRCCRVLGKGNKYRQVMCGKDATRALWDYLRAEHRQYEENEPLFLSDRGTDAGRAMTRNGLFQLIQRLGQQARIQTVRCSPHTFRHSFAVTFLRNGGNTFTLKELLGHTTLTMTNKYVALADADLENQHRQFSPVDSLKRKGR